MRSATSFPAMSIVSNASAICVLFGALLFASTTNGQEQSPDSTEVLQICMASADAVDGLTKIDVEGKPPIFVDSESVVSRVDIESVEAKLDRSGRKNIYLRLTAAGGEKLATASASNLGKPMAILFNGNLVSAPVIRSKISRDVVINGNFSEDRIQEMLQTLQPDSKRSKLKSFEPESLEKFSKRLDRAFENRLFSGTVLIAVDGKIVFEKSVGFANIDDETPFAENSSFRLASVSKQFVAMGIMQLKEDGKLDFDDDITKYLPTLPYKGVTIRHLLNHTGGLTDYMDLFRNHWDTDAENDERKTAFNHDMIALYAEHKPDPDFEPGERYAYSNTGYVLLGSIIESVSGHSIHDFLKQRIFDPVGMTDSHAFSPDEQKFDPANRVFGFAWQGTSHVANDWNYLNGMVGDGGIYASARDLLKWDQALYGEKLVSRKTLTEAFTPGKLNNGDQTDYGFGWMVERSADDGLTVSHGGHWVGFQTSILRGIDRKLTVILLSNNSTQHLDQITRAIDQL
ncbi:serine hydrolase domain-containing protein [Mariniblastus fucicola]|uniref:Penicillin-binding protein 4 n=1 Tax=Mariniblastus fucicola TaxID=980251 RepID=A0A5B9PK58_9BACT|nr:serine hydrolase domain-containing protein [Mariniblastus fucicola]QEG22873.1 Penicillin-binding protein 4* [Mariniblastus fucicola]